MHRCVFTLVVFGVTALSAYGQTADPEAARAALRQANIEYCQIITAKDAARLASMYDSNASMFPPSEARITGTDGVQGWTRQFLALPALAASSCSPSQVDVASSGDLGYTLFNYDMSYTGPNGQPVNERGRDLLVWRKQPDGSWKITMDIWNSEPPR